MNVPKLRFKEFDGEWEEKSFAELLDDRDGIRRGPFGSALKKEIFVPESDYVVYEQQNAIYDKYTTRYNITRDKYEELIKFSLNPGDYIMSGAGTIGRISRVPKDIKKGVFNQALIRFRIKSEVTDSEYFLQFMRAEKMQRRLTGANPGSAITNLVPMSELKKWPIIIPQIKEQQKIGMFFEKIDKKIQLQQQKIDLLQEQKKGFLQKMFPKAGETQPEMRFDGFMGDWKQCKLNNYLKTSKVKNTNEVYTKFDVLSVSGDYGIVNQIEFQGRSFAGVSVAPYGIVEQGDIVYTKSPLKSNPYGIIKVNKGKPGIVSTLYAIYKVRANVDPNFVEYYFADDLRLNKYLKPLVNKGAKNDMKVSDDNALIGDVVFPTDLEEQLRIAEFFKKLEDAINIQQQKLDLLRKQKQGFMQQMFI